ncbi:MAG: hypothetical protein UX59_C0045G0008, partial [Microgenomates group bacterium GW2011_GWA1_46_7]
MYLLCLPLDFLTGYFLAFNFTFSFTDFIKSIFKSCEIVSTQIKGKKQLFIAESPDQLESVIERERKAIEYKKEEL